MAIKDKIKALLEQITDLPDAAQNELIEALLEMRAEHLGLYPLDDEEQEKPAFSAENIHLSRIASE